MRPKSIVMFERVVLISIVLGIINSFLIWDRLVADAAEQGMSSNSVLVIQGITIAISLLLMWLIARKASPVAKWIYIVLSVLGIIAGAAGISETLSYGTVAVVLTAIQYALWAYSIWLLFRPDAKAWFSDGREEAGPDGHR